MCLSQHFTACSEAANLPGVNIRLSLQLQQLSGEEDQFGVQLIY